MSPISVRGFAVASATAVTAVGSVVGVASGSTAQTNDAEPTATDSTLLADIPAGRQAQVQSEFLKAQANVQAIAADSSARKHAEEAARKAAARTAIEKKEEAEKAAQEAKERKAEEAESKAPRDASDFAVSSSYTVAQIRSMARQMVPSDQFQCFSNIVDHESDWNFKAVNPSSGAYGLFQALPGSKMSSVDSDWRSNPATQIEWGLNYMNGRYDSPCGAWDFWQANHWY